MFSMAWYRNDLHCFNNLLCYSKYIFNNALR